VRLARKRLKGHWGTVISVEAIVACIRIFILIIEIALLSLLKFHENQTEYMLIIATFLVVDWLIVSPLLLGRTIVYWDIISMRTVKATRVFYGFKLYAKAVMWRAGRFVRRLGWSIISYAPAVILFGIAPVLRVAPVTPRTDALMLMVTIGRVVLPVMGFVVCEIQMTRYAPADCLLAAGNGRVAVQRLFKRSRKMMRGHAGAVAWQWIGFGGLWLGSLLIVPLAYTVPIYRVSRLNLVRKCVVSAPSEVINEKRCKNYKKGIDKGGIV